MDDQMVKLLEKLNAFAAQMGVKADELWPILVAHQWWESLIKLIALGSVALVFGVIAAAGMWAMNQENYIKSPSDDGATTASVVGVLGFMLFAVLASNQVPDLLYPEADALNWLLQRF